MNFVTGWKTLGKGINAGYSYYLWKTNVFGGTGILESACLSVNLCVHLSVYPSVYKILFSVKALVEAFSHI